MKTILQHPRTAWWLACLLSASPFLIVIFGAQLVPTFKPYSQEVTIRTDGATGDILAAVKSLKRSDLTITVKPNPLPRNPELSLVYSAVYLTLWFAFSAAMVSSAEIKMRQLLHTKN